MFVELIRRYDHYMEAQKAVPYNAEHVQGRGMYFCDEWNRLKSEICQHLQMDEKDFDYNKARLWMVILKRTV